MEIWEIGAINQTNQPSNQIKPTIHSIIESINESINHSMIGSSKANNTYYV